MTGPLHLQQIVTMWGNLRKLHFLVFWEKMEAFGKGSSFQFLDTHKWLKISLIKPTRSNIIYLLAKLDRHSPVYFWCGLVIKISSAFLLWLLLLHEWWFCFPVYGWPSWEIGKQPMANEEHWQSKVQRCLRVYVSTHKLRRSQQFQNPNSLSSVWISTYVLKI